MEFTNFSTNCWADFPSKRKALKFSDVQAMQDKYKTSVQVKLLPVTALTNVSRPMYHDKASKMVVSF